MDVAVEMMNSSCLHWRGVQLLKGDVSAYCPFIGIMAITFTFTFSFMLVIRLDRVKCGNGCYTCTILLL